MRRVLAVLVALSAGCSGGSGGDLERVKAGVRAKFPGVRQITTEELARRLSDRAKPVVLVDARSEKEFAVSRIPGARRAEDSTDGIRALGDVPKDAAIVAYCSVGYRSSGLAEKMQKAGWKDVANLEGSIFQWANEGRPLVDAKGQPAALVHPYDEEWGRLLRPELRAPAK
jgi:rhodanese-related sulfurtransferase